MVTAPEAASAAKGGGGGGGGSKGGGSNGAVYGRVSFTDAGFAIHNDHVASCTGAQYWLNLDGNQDPDCTTATSGYMEVGFPSPDGLLLRTHATPTIITASPNPNRYVEIQFTPLDPDVDSCPNLDQNYDPSNPDFQGYVPVPNPDPCVDLLEATLALGNSLFDPSTTRVECADDNNCPNLVVDLPQWSQRRHKPAELTWPEHLGTIRFRSGLDVTHSPDGNTAVLTCSSTCEAEMKQNGVVVGEYDMPFQVTFTKVTVQ